MSTMNIAIVGGVVLLVLVLVKMRRLNAEESPSGGRARSRGERRRRRGKDSPPAPPEPMPLAAAAGQTAATTAPGPMSPPSPGWEPTTSPGEDGWLPIDDGSPVEWPPPGAAPTVSSAVDTEPQAAAPDATPTAGPWAEDGIVTEPGWPMPGEVDVAWSPPASHEPVSMQGVTVDPVAADTEIAWDETAASSAPAQYEWLGTDAADDEIPAWSPGTGEHETAPAEESFSWGAPATEEPAWAQTDEVSSPDGVWGADAVGAPEDSQLTGEFPSISLPDSVSGAEFDGGTDPASVGDVGPGAEVEAADEFPGVAGDAAHATYAPFSDPEPEIEYAFPPMDDVAPSDEPTPMEEFAPVEEFAAVEEFAPVREFAPVDDSAAVAPPAPVVEPVAAWDEIDPLDSPVAAAVPADPPVAWWDEAPEGEAEGIETGPTSEPTTVTGRFALGGFALQPGQQSLGGVTFRVELDRAPTAWMSVESPRDAEPGTLVLVLDGAINCSAQSLEVVMDPGFAPSTQGFAVRASALAAGPFAASGTFRVV